MCGKKVKRQISWVPRFTPLGFSTALTAENLVSRSPNTWIFWPTPQEVNSGGLRSGKGGLSGTLSGHAAGASRVHGVVQRIPLLAEAKPQPPKAAILYKQETMLLLEIDGQTQNRTNEAARSLIGCHEALRRKHLRVTFIDLQRLKSGLASR